MMTEVGIDPAEYIDFKQFCTIMEYEENGIRDSIRGSTIVGGSLIEYSGLEEALNAKS
jgi:hypothetical protein